MEVMWVTGKASLMNHKQESCFTKLYIELHKIAIKQEQLEILKSDFSFSLENWMMTLSKSFKLSIPLSANIRNIYSEFPKGYELYNCFKTGKVLKRIVGKYFEFFKKNDTI